MYRASGIDLVAEPLVGLGSVCRRQGSRTIAAIVGELASYGFALHGFGVKTTGLGRYAGQLTSADSMACSYGARHRRALAGCSHRSCANCVRWALRWREQVIRRASVQQLTLTELWCPR